MKKVILLLILALICVCSFQTSIGAASLSTGLIVGGQLPVNTSYFTFQQYPVNSQRYLIGVNLRPTGNTAYSGAKITVKYKSNQTPSGWTLNIGDSVSNDGYGGDSGNQYRDAEAEIQGNYLAVYENQYGTSQRCSIQNSFVNAGSEVTIQLSDNYISYSNGQITKEVKSPYIYAFNGETDPGGVNYQFYIGVNRVVSNGSSSSRYGTGVESVQVELLSDFNPLANATFIDPTYTGTPTGSITQPYSSWHQFTIQANRSYYQKYGTTFQATARIPFNNSCTIGAYGNTLLNRPIIQTSADRIFEGWKKEKVTIKDMQLIGNNKATQSCIYFNSLPDSGASNMLVDNCSISHAEWGIRATGGGKYITVKNSEIGYTYDDGVFFQDTDNALFDNCYVHHVNQNWQPPSTPETVAGGDGIQFSRCSNWTVKNSVIDRSDNGNKFGIISGEGYLTPSNCRIENTTIYTPYTNGKAIHLQDTSTITIINCSIIGTSGDGSRKVGIQNHDQNTWVENCIFNNLGYGIYNSTSSDYPRGSAILKNNQFINVDIPYYGDVILL